MPTVSKLLKVSKITHPTLGQVVELYSPTAEDDTAAYFINSSRNKVDGVGIRLSKKTALSLAQALMGLAKESKKRRLT